MIHQNSRKILHWFRHDDQKESLSRIWAIGWPMTLIMFFEFLIGVADVFIAGKISKEVQASYGFVTQIYFMFTVIGNAFTVGTVAVISRLCARRESDEYAETIFSAVATTVVAGSVLGLAGVLTSSFIINLLNVPAEVKEFGIPLIEIYAGGSIFHYILINTNGILRACQGVTISLRTMAIVAIMNISLNFLLVFYTPIGYRGIALSTALSVLIGSMLNLWKLRAMIFRRMKFTALMVKRIFKIGWPSGLLQIMWQLGATIIFLILSALPENNVEIIAAFTNGYRIESIIYLPAFAFNMANAVIVGNYLGEDKMDGAFRNGLLTAGLGLGLVTLLSVIILLNTSWIVGHFSTNAVVLEYSRRYLFICLPIEPFMAWGVILGGGLNGAGDTRGVMFQIAFGIWMVRIPFSYILGIVLQLGAPGVWWAMNASIIVQAILITRRYLKRRWLQHAS